jgi:transposase
MTRPTRLIPCAPAARQFDRDLVGGFPSGPAADIPPHKQAGPLRETVNSIFYVMRGGVAWRLLPSDLPSRSTFSRWFAACRDDGVFEAPNHALLMITCKRSGRPVSPSACIIDGQSVKPNETGGPRGYDAGKKIMVRKRQALFDTDGRGRDLFAHPASV